MRDRITLVRNAGVAILGAAAAAGADVVVFEFEGTLPPGATLARSSARADAQGNLIPPDAPRWQTAAITPQAQRLAVAGPDVTILDARAIQTGQVLTVVSYNGLPAYTFDTPGLDPGASYTAAPASLAAKFVAGGEWGRPFSAEIFSSGAIVIHTEDSWADRRSKTVRTTLDTFAQPDGWRVTRVGDYAAPQTGPWGPARAPVQFTRPTYLPNLGIEVSTPVDYRSWGVLSSLERPGWDQTGPPDGRALGYGSTDEGRTYSTVIDTDDELLGRPLVEAAKHLHHIEPFEWFDARTGEWKIGAIGLLGDGAGRAGQLVLKHDAQTFRLDPVHEGPDPVAVDDKTHDLFEQDPVPAPRIWRTKRVGLHLLTDLFPLNNTEMPGQPLRFLAGADASQSGMVELTIRHDDEVDRVLFRSVTTFDDDNGQSNVLSTPYVFQIGRLESGIFAAPTTEGRQSSDPNHIWVSDPTAEHWVTAYTVHHPGWKGVTPIGGDRFWTIDQSMPGGDDELWQVAPPVVRPALMLAPEATPVALENAFKNNDVVTTTDVSGAMDPPGELPDDTPVLRVSSPVIERFDRLTVSAFSPVSAQPGQLVQLRFWIKPARPDIRVTQLKVGVELQTPGQDIVPIKGNTIALDLNDWTRVVETVVVPPEGATGARPALFPKEDAVSELPLDYCFTPPRLVVADQPTIQHPLVESPTGADRLEQALPALGSSWTVMIWATEAPGLVASFLDPSGGQLLIDHTNGPGGSEHTGTDTRTTASFDSATPGALVLGESEDRDIYLPAQSVVAVTHDSGVTAAYVSRGMGELELIGSAPTGPFAPGVIRFGSPDWSRTTNGLLHRVKVWTDSVLDPGAIADQLLVFDPEPGTQRLPEDVNADGVVNVLDITRVILSLGTRDHSNAPDVDGDGSVTVSDVVRVILRLGEQAPTHP